MSLFAELGSTLSSIETIAERLERTATGLGDDDPAYRGLIDVERGLRTASRRLERLLRDLEPG